MKLLTVDDSAMIRRIIAEVASVLGFDPVEARDGHEAIELLRGDAAEIAVVLLDWNMPGLNGLDVLRVMKGDLGLKHLPVVMVTTEGEQEKMVQAIQAGAAHYVTKPFTQEDLAGRIMQSMGQGAGGCA
ncbi:MAG: response regulator [Gammaproteobacteria bacterium]